MRANPHGVQNLFVGKPAPTGRGTFYVNEQAGLQAWFLVNRRRLRYPAGMKQALLLITIFLCATAGAQVYKRIGPDGQVYFSDQPGSGAEPVELNPPQVISMPPLPERSATAVQRGGGAEKRDDSVFSYTRFSVTSPTKYQGYRANDGNITVRLSLEPELRPGHRVLLNVDGEDGEKLHTGGGMVIELQNLSRGRHTVWAKVVDDNGKTFIRTEPVGFYVLRFAGGGR